MVLAAHSGVAAVACAGSAAESLGLADHGGFGAALVDLGLPKAEIASLVGALHGAGARVIGLAGTDAEAAAGRRAGVDAVGRAERPLAALLVELFPEDGSLPATAPDDRRRRTSRSTGTRTVAWSTREAGAACPDPLHAFPNPTSASLGAGVDWLRHLVRGPRTKQNNTSLG